MKVPVTYTVHIHDDDDSLWAEVVELPGCFASGNDQQELEDNIAEAIGLYLSAPGSICKATVVEVGPAERIEERKILVTS